MMGLARWDCLVSEMNEQSFKSTGYSERYGQRLSGKTQSEYDYNMAPYSLRHDGDDNEVYSCRRDSVYLAMLKEVHTSAIADCGRLLSRGKFVARLFNDEDMDGPALLGP